MTLLKVDGLGIVLDGIPVLEGISLSIAKGQRLGMIGETGSGKSVLALALVGLSPPQARLSGSISYDDKPLSDSAGERAALRRMQVGMLMQHAAAGFDPLRSIGEHVAEALSPLAPRNVLPTAIEAVLRDNDLDPDLSRQYPGDLNLAQRQRVMLALALANKPALLIADMPSAGLDLVAQRQIFNQIERHCREREMALLLISHDLKAIAMLCEKIIVLKAGRIIEAGDKAEIFGRPRHDDLRAILSAGRQRARALMRTPIGGTLLDVRNVSRRYRQPDRSIFEPRRPLLVLDNVTLSIRAGESAALVGPSGSGKSTLARIIAGLERASSGEMTLDQTVYHGPDLPLRLRATITLVGGDSRLAFDPQLTVGELIAEPLRLELQRTIDELGARILEVMSAVGLPPDVLARMPAEFSTGHLQRLAIARALVTRPRLVILDEPVAGLDLMARGETLVLLNRLRADFGMSFLVISHDLDVVRTIADRVMVLDHGRIVETGTPAQLLDNPQQPITQQLVAAALPDIGIVPVF